MNKRQILVLFLSALLGATAYGQTDAWSPGYYLNRQQDTIYGQFNFARFSSNTVLFTASGDGNVTSLKPEEVVEITAGADLRIITHSMPVDGHVYYLFLQQIGKGNIHLFLGPSPQGRHVFYLSSEKNPSLRKIPVVEPDRFLSAYFPECAQVKVRPRYNTPSLQAALRAYQACLDAGVVLQESENVLIAPPFHWEIGLSGILARDQTRTSGWMGIRADPAFQPGLGLSTRLSFGQTLVEMGVNFNVRKIALQDSVRVISWAIPGNNATGYVTYPAPFDLRYQVFSFPLTITQRFGNRREGDGTFVVAGAALHLLRGAKLTSPPRSYWITRLNEQEYYTPQVYSLPSVDPKDFLPSGLSSSLFAGVGYSKKINHNKRIELSLRYALLSEKLLSFAPMQLNTRRLELVSAYFFTPGPAE